MSHRPSNALASSMKKSSSFAFRGKRMILSSWLSSKPFVTSFVEDQRKGTAKETRNNTLLNMDTRKVPCPDNLISTASSSTESSVSASSESLPSLSKLSTAANRTPHRTISFSTKVKVYSLENPCSPIEEDVKPPSPVPPLETRRKRAKSSRTVDIRQPITPVAQWLLRKTSTL